MLFLKVVLVVSKSQCEQHVFRVAGFNMVLSDEGAAAFLENDKGVTFPLVIDEVVSKQLFKAHTAELLPGGDYKLVVKSRAGDADGPLQTSFRKVKYLRVVDPAPGPTFTKVTAPGHEDDPDWTNKVSRDGQIVVLGTGFTDAVTAEFSTDGNPETFNVTARTSTSITGQIAGGLEAGGTLVMELKDGAGDVIDTAAVEVVE